MATGDSQPVDVALTQDDVSLILPVEMEACPRHPEEALRLFCDLCRVPMCLECSGSEHDGHPNALARKRSAEILQHVQHMAVRLQDRRKSAEYLAARRRQRRDEIEKALKEFNEEKKKCEKELDELETELESLELLESTASSIDSTSTLSSIATLTPRVHAALGVAGVDATGAADTTSAQDRVAKLRADYQGLVPVTPRSDEFTEGQVALPIEYYYDWRRFVDGLTDTIPPPPRWPDSSKALRWYHNYATEVAIIPAEDAAQLLKQTGGRITLVMGWVNHWSALVAPGGDGEAEFVNVVLKEGAQELGWWLLPAGRELGEAVGSATGRFPTRLTGEMGGDVPLSRRCGEWRQRNNCLLQLHY